MLKTQTNPNQKTKTIIFIQTLLVIAASSRSFINERGRGIIDVIRRKKGLKS